MVKLASNLVKLGGKCHCGDETYDTFDMDRSCRLEVVTWQTFSLSSENVN